MGLADKTVRAGEYHAIGYDLQGMSQQQLEATKAQLEAAKTKLESKDQVQLASLTKHDLTGAILQANVQSYFAVNDAQDYLATANSSIVANRHLSFGTFQTYIQPNQRYGISLGGKMAGLQMDIDSMRPAAVSKDNSLDQLRGFILTQGPRQSANEHLIPEALFDDPSTTAKEVQGVSAVKALSIASQQGQKIYTINQTNINQVLPLLRHKAAVIEDVQNAVSAGKIVTISEHMISANGWTGSGYIIVDPVTGAGAYLIGGAADGGLMIALGMLYIALAVCLFLEGLAAAPLTVGTSAWFASQIAFNTALAGFVLILKGVEMLTSGTDAGKSTCSIFTLFWGGLLGNLIGRFASWLVPSSATGAEIANTFAGLMAGLAVLVKDDLCYHGE